MAVDDRRLCVNDPWRATASPASPRTLLGVLNTTPSTIWTCEDKYATKSSVSFLCSFMNRRDVVSCYSFIQMITLQASRMQPAGHRDPLLRQNMQVSICMEWPQELKFRGRRVETVERWSLRYCARRTQTSEQLAAEMAARAPQRT